MARYKFSKEEQETTIRFDGNLDTVHVFTAYPAIKRKLDRLGFTPRKVSRMGGAEIGWFYHVPYTQFRWGLKRRVTLTPEQREARVARGRALQSRSTVKNPQVSL